VLDARRRLNRSEDPLTEVLPRRSAVALWPGYLRAGAIKVQQITVAPWVVTRQVVERGPFDQVMSGRFPTAAYPFGPRVGGSGS